MANPSSPAYHFSLETLGWKGFQDLCLTITREILDQEVTGFLDTNDAGRDGAFHGVWEERDASLRGAFVIQCKFKTARANLTLSDISDEIGKARALVEQELCDTYILMTNAGVSGRTEGQVRQALRDVGVQHIRVFGRTWLEDQIKESARLRALVPRLYGLGDLSEILDERAYEQAKVVLESMKESLSKFVVTQPYDRSIRALNEYGFVLLLGEPAAGKTTIASALAVAAADQWNARVIKVTSPDDLKTHWNPHAKHQFFWVDDAFGVNQYQLDLVHEWNHLLPTLHAAIGRGARIVFTSRDYIYRAARLDLKEETFPLFAETQVVIRVQDLPLADRQQILYNHMKLGRQSHTFRSAIKPHLNLVAENRLFLPEVARRLGDPVFTRDLSITPEGVRTFVEEPVDFLFDVLRTLDTSQRAALSLIYVAGGELPSPIELNAEEERALKLFDASIANCASALVGLEGSMVTRVHKQGRDFWTFRHPTVGDALGRLVADNPELLDIYLAGSPIEKLMREVTCGDVDIEGVVVRVPRSRFSLIANRLPDPGSPFSVTQSLYGFLFLRCSDEFLATYVSTHGSLLENLSKPMGFLAPSPELWLVQRLHRLGFFGEEHRIRFVEHVRDLAVDIGDTAYLRNTTVRSLLEPQEISSIKESVRHGLIPELEQLVEQWRHSYDPESGDVDSHLRDLREILGTYREEFADDEDALQAISDASASVDGLEGELEMEFGFDPEDIVDLEEAKGAVEATLTARSIFDDVDV